MTDANHTTDAELERLGTELARRMSVERRIVDRDVSEETDVAFKAARETSGVLIARCRGSRDDTCRAARQGAGDCLVRLR